jgi:hypothetical protein
VSTVWCTTSRPSHLGRSNGNDLGLLGLRNPTLLCSSRLGFRHKPAPTDLKIRRGWFMLSILVVLVTAVRTSPHPPEMFRPFGSAISLPLCASIPSTSRRRDCLLDGLFTRHRRLEIFIDCFFEQIDIFQRWNQDLRLRQLLGTN